MRIPAALAALFFLGTFAPPSLHAPLPIPDRSLLRFDPVPLSAEEPERRRVGGITYLGGWKITSNDPRFGGLSAMHIDGETLVAVSDAGSIVETVLSGGAGAHPARIQTLADGPGPIGPKANRDSEALAMLEETAWIGFENHNAVWRYARPGWRSEARSRPAAMRDWHHNRGAEAMVRLSDGRFLVFAEGRMGADGTSEALLFTGDPAEEGTKAIPLRYRPPEGYRITDAAALPDGRLLFLNRKIGLLGGFTAKLTIAPLPMIEPGTVLAGSEIATLEPPFAVDNMEALSVTQENGRTIVWMASDDNFSPLQRTLLMKFALENSPP